MLFGGVSAAVIPSRLKRRANKHFIYCKSDPISFRWRRKDIYFFCYLALKMGNNVDLLCFHEHEDIVAVKKKLEVYCVSIEALPIHRKSGQTAFAEQ